MAGLNTAHFYGIMSEGLAEMKTAFRGKKMPALLLDRPAPTVEQWMAAYEMLDVFVGNAVPALALTKLRRPVSDSDSDSDSESESDSDTE